MLPTGVARAVPEILYFRCPNCSKRFPGSTFADESLYVECHHCGAEVESPHAPLPPSHRHEASPFSVAPEEVEFSDGIEDPAADITEQLRVAFETLSQVDQERFLNEAVSTPAVSAEPLSDKPSLPFSRATHVIAIAVLLIVGVLLLGLLYVDTLPAEMSFSAK